MLSTFNELSLFPFMITAMLCLGPFYYIYKFCSHKSGGHGLLRKYIKKSCREWQLSGGGGGEAILFGGTRYSILLASGSPTLSCFFRPQSWQQQKSTKVGVHSVNLAGHVVSS